ncbi:uncharacterized protein PgNI_00450 [Pyricularia grisea]|uniref:Uncharacterized protein n=1 Tax=Pyricularia grisea TaxID=148305 RepID=A0A6P8BF84_PYRGI|nr:uncharacterized protein PgNI_00450 [Pyricularia grisea]TLD15375.1 hypothetical protein PgNI_00450 [Pyricularia grisea]
MDKTAAKRIASRGNDPAFAERAKRAAARNAGKDMNPPAGQSSSSQEPKKDEDKK